VINPVRERIEHTGRTLAVAVLIALALVGCRRRRGAQHPQTDFAAATVTGPIATVPTVSTVPVGAPSATPQSVSDGDRAAARDLYNEGVALQATRPQDALDKFQRSYAVLNAPTTYLHLVQCEVALGKLVEAAEGYRTIIRTVLPPGSSKPFFDAQTTASQELAQLEPRIPHVKIAVTPDRLTGLALALDGQTYNVALVGASRPIDPGSHKLVVTAPGYVASEQSFDVKEREQKDVAIALRRR
jgi:hypothetical protein